MTHFEKDRECEQSPRSSVASNDEGIAATEFAIVAPMFLLILMAIFDFGFAIYTKAVLQGAIEEGARTASLENTQFSTIRTRVNQQVLTVLPASNPDTDISFTIDPTYYENYNDLQLPEDFTDLNSNDQWDSNECYVDRNGNRSYDTDVGLTGRGGAQDVVSINAKVDYKRIFPFWNMIGQPDRLTLEANTFLRNQPFSAQAARVGVEICP